MKRFFQLGMPFVFAALLSGQEFRLGSKVDDFNLRDLSGNTVRFSSLKGDLTVVTFIATQCPVSNAYNERMKELYGQYAPKGVKFVFVNANRTEPASEVQSHSVQHGFPFPVYKDENNEVADRFGAQVTPEAFVIDKTGVIRYHGSIDDSQILAKVSDQRLQKALDALLEGAPVQNAETKAFGCTIKRMKKTS